MRNVCTQISVIYLVVLTNDDTRHRCCCTITPFNRTFIAMGSMSTGYMDMCLFGDYLYNHHYVYSCYVQHYWRVVNLS